MHMPKRDFDKDAASWDEDPKKVKLANAIADTLLREVRPDTSMDVLDFGCGTGLVTLRLQPLVRSIMGIDSSRGMLDVLAAKIQDQKLENIDVRCFDIEEGDGLPGTYDLIVSSMTFHHIRHPGQLFRQFRNHLKPSGRLCIADLDCDDGEFHSNNEGVFHSGFDRKAFAQEFRDAGFQEVSHLTAAEILRPVASGGERLFKIFLMTGRA